MAPAGTGTTSPSELADYAFCPRAHWYRHHPPAGGPSPEALRRAEAGTRYHARTLRATRLRAERGPTYWLLVVVGAAAVVGGLLWLLL
jgi:CRISPR/Cas system-associated exonuclease Cas4 (RecB family)